jgi:hypothetical protein
MKALDALVPNGAPHSTPKQRLSFESARKRTCLTQTAKKDTFHLRL